MQPAPYRTALLCFALLSMSLQAQSDLPAGTWRIANAPAELGALISRGDLIVVSMQDALLRELTSALAQGGPAFAIQSCHIDVIDHHCHQGRPAIAAIIPNGNSCSTASQESSGKCRASV